MEEIKMEEIKMEEINLNEVKINTNTNIIFIYEHNKDIVTLLLDKGIKNGYKEINKLVIYQVIKKLIKIIDKIPKLKGEQKKNYL